MSTQLGLPPIGTTIRKHFPPHGYFWGQVVFYTFGGKYCRVVYEDGDSEDLFPTYVRTLACTPPRRLNIPSSMMVPSVEDLRHTPAMEVPMLAPSAQLSSYEYSQSQSSVNIPSHAQTQTSVRDEAIRRSKRTKTSTVVWVGKDAVKRENNYIVKGVSYHSAFDNAESEKPRSNNAVMDRKRPPALQQSNTTKKVRKLSPEERARLDLKQRIEQNIQDKKNARAAFLARHAADMRPFCPDLRVEEPSAEPAAFREEVMQPDDIKADLRDYQLAGMNFMASMYHHNIGMILGDEMGLGKTVQTLSLICHLRQKYETRFQGPNLVVCPLSVLYSWCSEVEKWCPSLKCCRFHCSNAESLTQESFTSYDIVVTTYEMVSSATLSNFWCRHYFNLVVLDEGHRIKSSKTLVSQAVRKIHAECRIVLTGTPLQNNLTELWAILNFLEPKVFASSEEFDNAFDLTTNTIDNTKLSQAHALLKVFMLRRLKATVENLPPRIETKVVCPLSTTQMFFYKALLLKDLGALAEGSNKQILNNLVMNLRKCCLHPWLFPDVETEGSTLEDLIGSSGKLAVLDLLLQSLYEKKHRVTLFSQFTRVLDILEDYCTLRGWNFCRFDGGTARARRNHIINAFNAPESDRFIFLMSTRSGGMGINLQTADTCILYDSDWNPQPDIQAIGRTHRLGQKKTVHVYRLCTHGTIEERMLERAEKKLYLDKIVTRNDNTMKSIGDDTDKDNLLSTIRFGCQAVFGSAMTKQELPTKEEIELICDRSRSENFTSGKLNGNSAFSADAYDPTKEFTSTMSFAGVDFRRLREEHQKRPNTLEQISEAWQKRQRKQRIQLVDGVGTGYGKSLVPVLSLNSYDLQTGESSVFERELNGRHKTNKLKSTECSFESQDFCQVCGDGGNLLCCPKCPVVMHLSCSQVSREKDFRFCTHHNCSVCRKTASAAGGLLYPCAECPNAYCEDHLPPKCHILEDGCKRMEKLGHHIKNGVYVLCSDQCADVAKNEWNWAHVKSTRAPCPKTIDISSYFGGCVDDIFNEKSAFEQKMEERRGLSSTSKDDSRVTIPGVPTKVEQSFPDAPSLINSDKENSLDRSDSTKENDGFDASRVIDLTDA